ncbi:MAG: hypothetical protein BM557_03680 [Flavobacterium sp. MedPE-SWcel]|uniref:hypothetical protein n=1 Tax=uncultured Flavobacterium sp. TaxID=165435 RepID=UPI0009216FED|nr:hypothetical protein [uncultured Flavobacterium sp.]OIQ21362.1 MAG: hypothetical protein BM557_03680 [Flavobacterium sp. MedPE-SWcel]
MEKLKFYSDLVPTEENNLTIKTQNGVLLRDVRKFIEDNFIENFSFLELFYDSNTDKIRVNKIEGCLEDKYSDFTTKISNSQYGCLFEF